MRCRKSGCEACGGGLASIADGNEDDCKNRPGRPRSWRAMTGLLSLKDFIEVRKAILADLSGDCLTGNKEGLVNRAFHELKYGRQPKASILT